MKGFLLLYGVNGMDQKKLLEYAKEGVSEKAMRFLKQSEKTTSPIKGAMYFQLYEQCEADCEEICKMIAELKG